MDDFLQILQDSALATNIREGVWQFPLLEATHVLGLALVVGTILVIDLRLLGLASTRRPFETVAHDILKWTWTAFALTLITGSLMFITNATVYYHNFFFRTKMVLLALTAVNMLAFERTARRRVREWNQAPSAPRSGKAIAVVSLVLWVGVIFTGRWIGFTTSRATVEEPPPADVDFGDFLGGDDVAPPAAPNQ